MSKERNIQILEHNISQLNTKIANFEEHNISEVKRDRLIAKRDRYQQQLDELNAE